MNMKRLAELAEETCTLLVKCKQIPNAHLPHEFLPSAIVEQEREQTGE